MRAYISKHPMSLQSISSGHQDYNEAVKGSLSERVGAEAGKKSAPESKQVEDVFEADSFDSLDLHPWLIRALPGMPIILTFYAHQ